MRMLRTMKNRVLYRGARVLLSFILDRLGRLFPQLFYPISAVTVILEEGEKILAIRRADGLGWSLPGGIVHWGETPEHAVVRETREETGLEIGNPRLVTIRTKYPTNARLSVINFIYTGQILGGRLEGSPEGDPRWVLPHELVDERYFDTSAILHEFYTGQYPFPFLQEPAPDVSVYTTRLKYLSRYKIREFIRWCRTNLTLEEPILDLGSGYRDNRPEVDPGRTLRFFTFNGNPEFHPDYVGDAHHMDQIADGAFGTVVCTELLEHVERPSAVLSEVARILKPKGLFIFTVPFWVPLHEKPPHQLDFWRFTPRGIRFLLSSHFQEVSLRVSHEATVPVAIVGYAHKRP